MTQINAKITGVGGYVPEYRLTNEALSQMVDTTDEWIMTRIGIKERRILKGEAKGVSYMAERAINQLLEKTGTSPEEIDLLVCSTVAPDRLFPATANIICDKVNIKNAFSFDINAGCSGFLYALDIAQQYVKSGRSKKAVVVAAEKMSHYTDYTDRQTCPLFGDGSAAVLLEPTTEGNGVIDAVLHADGMGRNHLHMKAGGSEYPTSIETVKNREHFVYQEGRIVFKHAVEKMAEVVLDVMNRNNLTGKDVDWLVPHQANLRIISATGNRMNLSPDKIMINIERYGNTSSATIPLCLWDWESKLKRGDKLILTAFGAGFTWGAIYLEWAYDAKS